MRFAPRIRGLVFTWLVVVGVVWVCLQSQLPTAKGAPKGAKKPDAKVEAKLDPALPAPPTDPLDLRLRVTALITLYELDFSDNQLTLLRAAAVGTADSHKRRPSQSTPALTAALQEFHQVLLKGEQVDRINELRVEVTGLEEDEAVELDEDVQATNGARQQAMLFVPRMKASQIAAYLAEHADEIIDPAEQMMEMLEQVRDGDSDEPEAAMKQAALEVGWMVAGADAVKAKAVSDQVTAWFTSGRAMTEADFAEKQALMEASAKKITNDLSPITLLGNWFQVELATLMSNPQLVPAIDQLSAVRAKAQ